MLIRTTLLDSTFREGELFTVLKKEAKLSVAVKLVEAGVRRIELTVDYPPRTTEEDVRPLVKALNDLGAEVVLHGRAAEEDVLSAAKYDVFGLAFYIAASKIHRIHKLHGISFEEAISRLSNAVQLARQHGFKYIRATVEDASRFYVEEEFEQLVEAVNRLGKAGATLVSVPDTAGLMSPRTASDFIQRLKQATNVPLAAHFHNDYGMASANTVEAILQGVDEAHVTIMGVGDRNGIADLYEVVATLSDIHGIDMKVDRAKLNSLYNLFSKVSGTRIPWRHPLSEEARTIRAGVHQAMAVEKPEGYVPKKKLEYDFKSPVFYVGVYTSHRLVASLTGLDAKDPLVRKTTEALALKARDKNGALTPREIAAVIAETTGITPPIDRIEKIVKGERAYLLVKLNTRYDPSEVLRELSGWDDVEFFDEVYGDVDLVVVGQLRLNHDNFVERFKNMFSSMVEDLKILISD